MRTLSSVLLASLALVSAVNAAGGWTENINGTPSLSIAAPESIFSGHIAWYVMQNEGTCEVFSYSSQSMSWRRLADSKFKIGKTAVWAPVIGKSPSGKLVLENENDLWVSVDEGENWESVQSPELIYPTQSSAAYNVMLEANDLIGHRLLLGVFQAAPSPNREIMGAALFGDKGLALAVRTSGDSGTNGNYLILREAGKSAEVRVLPQKNFDLGPLFVGNDGVIWAASYYVGGVFRSRDMGASWERVPFPDRIAAAIYFKNLKHGRVMSAYNGAVFETRDGGITWGKLSSAQMASSTFLEFFEGSSYFSQWAQFGAAHLLAIAQERRDAKQ